MLSGGNSQAHKLFQPQSPKPQNLCAQHNSLSGRVEIIHSRATISSRRQVRAWIAQRLRGLNGSKELEEANLPPPRNAHRPRSTT